MHKVGEIVTVSCRIVLCLDLLIFGDSTANQIRRLVMIIMSPMKANLGFLYQTQKMRRVIYLAATLPTTARIATASTVGQPTGTKPSMNTRTMLASLDLQNFR